MGRDEEVVRYQIQFNPKDLTVRLDVSGFRNEDEAMAFADWLSNIPYDDDTEIILH